MQVLLRAAFHIADLREGSGRVAIAVDAETGLRADTIIALLRPWRSWLEIVDLLVAPTSPGDEWLETVVASDPAAISIVSEREEFTRPLAERAAARGLSVLLSDYITSSARARAFLHEMAHHLYEIGGLNEWDGEPTQYSQFVLRQISAANCITHFPNYMIEELRVRQAELARPLDALDIGCGAISHLRWGAIQGLLNVTGVDPLLDVYAIVLAHHGLDALPGMLVDRPICAGGEQLDKHITPGTYDFAYCSNALDHVEDPRVVVTQIAHALRPGAPFALTFATREGSRQAWHQLHQFDLFLDESRNELMCQQRDGTLVPLVPDDAPLTLDRTLVATDDHTCVVLRHSGVVER